MSLMGKIGFPCQFARSADSSPQDGADSSLFELSTEQGNGKLALLTSYVWIT